MATLKALVGGVTHGDGRKFFRRIWHHPDSYFEPIFMTKDKWFGLFEGDADSHSVESNDWEEWHPPKKTKKVTLWRAIVFADDGYELSKWNSDKKYLSETAWKLSWASEGEGKIIGWESHEVEVDDV